MYFSVNELLNRFEKKKTSFCANHGKNRFWPFFIKPAFPSLWLKKCFSLLLLFKEPAVVFLEECSTDFVSVLAQ